MKLLEIISPEGERKTREIVDPLSPCSPTDLSLLEGNLDKILTTGVPVESCLRQESEVVR
jgi:hypothetical protein